MSIILESIVESLTTRQDGSITIKISTQELTPTKGGELLSYRGKFVKVLISNDNITQAEIKAVNDVDLIADNKGQSPSKRLRNVLYLLNQQENGDSVDSEFYYKSKMNEIIEFYKGKLK